MVGPWWLGCGLAAALVSPALAGPDWRAAGGAIFAETSDTPSLTPERAAAPAQWPERAQPFAAAVETAAAQNHIDPKLLHALVAVESAYRPRSVSPAGAGGLTQLMPSTAQAMGVADRFNPDANLVGGAGYLAQQLVRFRDLRLALAAYNAGPERVARLGRVPAIAETQHYVDAVVDCFLALSAGRAVRTESDCRGVGR